MIECWSRLCPLSSELDGITTWLEEVDWPTVRYGQPQRLVPPDSLVLPVSEMVKRCFRERLGLLHRRTCVSRVLPGNGHGYHLDSQPANWITRIHVPLITNLGCWMAFEEEQGKQIWFERGWAWSFNTTKRHAFGNDGKTERIHLLFDLVLEEFTP